MLPGVAWLPRLVFFESHKHWLEEDDSAEVEKEDRGFDLEDKASTKGRQRDARVHNGFVPERTSNQICVRPSSRLAEGRWVDRGRPCVGLVHQRCQGKTHAGTRCSINAGSDLASEPQQCRDLFARCYHTPTYALETRPLHPREESPPVRRPPLLHLAHEAGAL